MSELSHKEQSFRFAAFSWALLVLFAVLGGIIFFRESFQNSNATDIEQLVLKKIGGRIEGRGVHYDQGIPAHDYLVCTKKGQLVLVETFCKDESGSVCAIKSTRRISLENGGACKP